MRKKYKETHNSIEEQPEVMTGVSQASDQRGKGVGSGGGQEQEKTE